MDNKIIITMKDIQRYKVIQDVTEKRITGLQAAEILGLTNVHISRLKKRFQEGGFESLIRRPSSIPPNKRVTDEQFKRIIKLRRELYFDFNINHFKEKLNEKHHIPYCYTTIRDILIRSDLHSPKKKRIVHRMRRRMPRTGILVQMDSSQHNWLAHIKEKWWLIAMIDDANNEVPYACFFPQDTLFANMHVIRRFIEIKGLFISLYVDKASHFKTTRRAGIHYSVNPEQKETQIERAIRELDITLIPANSAQAKGRVERLFGTLQDRLISELRLAKIQTYEHANKFLVKTFLPDYNVRFSLANIDSDYRPLPQNINLDIIFCLKLERTVFPDNTIQLYGKFYQIPPSKQHLSFAKRKVDACILDDNRLIVLYNNKIVLESNLSKNLKNYKKEQKINKIINLREYFSTERKPYIPPPDHPWRKFRFGRSLTFQKVKSLTS